MQKRGARANPGAHKLWVMCLCPAWLLQKKKFKARTQTRRGDWLLGRQGLQLEMERKGRRTTQLTKLLWDSALLFFDFYFLNKHSSHICVWCRSPNSKVLLSSLSSHSEARVVCALPVLQFQVWKAWWCPWFTSGCWSKAHTHRLHTDVRLWIFKRWSEYRTA